MKQTNTIANSFSQQLSPEFQAWLDNEKIEARRHRQRILTVSLIAIVGIVIFLL